MVSPVWNKSLRLVISSAGSGCAGGDTADEHPRFLEITRALGGGHHDRRGAVGLEAAIEQTVRRRDHGRGEVVLEREGLLAHHRPRVALRVLAHRHRDRAELLRRGAELVHVAARHEREPLRRRREPVRDVVVARDRPSRNGREVGGDPFPGAHAGIAVPAGGQEHVVGDARDHGARGGLQRSDRRRAAHVHGRREAEILDAEVRRELFGRAEAGKRHDAVDLLDGDAGIRDRVDRRLQLDGELTQSGAGGAAVRGFTDSDDAGAVFEAHAIGVTSARRGWHRYMKPLPSASAAGWRSSGRTPCRPPGLPRRSHA